MSKFKTMINWEHLLNKPLKVDCQRYKEGTAKRSLKIDLKIAATAHLPTRFGEFRIIVFQEVQSVDNLAQKKVIEHVALIKGDITATQNIPVRIHSSCLTGDALSSLRCDCQEQLHAAMKYLAEQKHGILFYLNQEGRGIGLTNKIKAYALQEQGWDTYEANLRLGYPEDLRDYAIVACFLKFFHITSIKLLTNNPKKIHDLQRLGIKVTERIPLEIPPTEHNYRYLLAKKTKAHHYLSIIDSLEQNEKIKPNKLNMDD